MNEELKPCPFCGGEAVFQHYHTVDKAEFWYVQCPKCGATSWYLDTPEQIALRWNMRDNIIRKVRRKLKEFVKKLADYASEWSEEK